MTAYVSKLPQPKHLIHNSNKFDFVKGLSRGTGLLLLPSEFLIVFSYGNHRGRASKSVYCTDN